MLLFALKGALHAYFQLKGVLDPRFFLNTCDRKLLRVTWPDSCGDVRRLPSTFTWTLGKAVSVSWTPSTFFLFLFESSHVLPIDIYEVKSFLYNQSIWDARKLIFQPRFVFEMKDPHLLCNSRWRRTWWFFFSDESRRRAKKLKISRLLASNHLLHTLKMFFVTMSLHIEIFMGAT